MRRPATCRLRAFNTAVHAHGPYVHPAPPIATATQPHHTCRDGLERELGSNCSPIPTPTPPGCRRGPGASAVAALATVGSVAGQAQCQHPSRRTGAPWRRYCHRQVLRGAFRVGVVGREGGRAAAENGGETTRKSLSKAHTHNPCGQRPPSTPKQHDGTMLTRARVVVRTRAGKTRSLDHDHSRAAAGLQGSPSKHCAHLLRTLPHHCARPLRACTHTHTHTQAHAHANAPQASRPPALQVLLTLTPPPPSPPQPPPQSPAAPSGGRAGGIPRWPRPPGLPLPPRAPG